MIQHDHNPKWDSVPALAGMELIFWGTSQMPQKLYLATSSTEKPSMQTFLKNKTARNLRAVIFSCINTLSQKNLWPYIF